MDQCYPFDSNISIVLLKKAKNNFKKIENLKSNQNTSAQSKNGLLTRNHTQKNETCPVKIQRVEAEIQAYTHTLTHTHTHTHTHTFPKGPAGPFLHFYMCVLFVLYTFRVFRPIYPSCLLSL